MEKLNAQPVLFRWLMNEEGIRERIRNLRGEIQLQEKLRRLHQGADHSPEDQWKADEEILDADQQIRKMEAEIGRLNGALRFKGKAEE